MTHTGIHWDFPIHVFRGEGVVVILYYSFLFLVRFNIPLVKKLQLFFQQNIYKLLGGGEDYRIKMYY